MEGYARVDRDDILIYLKEAEVHFQHFQVLFNRLNEDRLKLNLAKGGNQIVGIHSKQNEVKLNIDKMEVIRDSKSEDVYWSA